MTTNINTGTINANYPTAGINNPSQGFRDNFASIKNNLETAGSEITDLQSKVLVKTALTGTTINNDMAGGQISNVLTLGFRKSIYELGNNLTGIVGIDCTKGDVHSGTVTNDCKLDFTKWPVTNMGSVEVVLSVVAGQRVSFPDNVVYGQTSLEGFDSATKSVVVPAGVTRLHWVFNSPDCGTSVEVVSLDNPRVSNQIKFGTPATSKGAVGDSKGAIMTDATYLYVCIADYTDGTVNIWTKTALTAPTTW